MTPAQLGRFGEWRAAWFYRLRGYSVLARNLRLRSGEIDLVVKRGATSVLTAEEARQLLDAIDVSTIEPQLAVAAAKLVRLMQDVFEREIPGRLEGRIDRRMSNISANSSPHVLEQRPSPYLPPVASLTSSRGSSFDMDPSERPTGASTPLPPLTSAATRRRGPSGPCSR